jgi:hypothetical protein
VAGKREMFCRGDEEKGDSVGLLWRFLFGWMEILKE